MTCPLIAPTAGRSAFASALRAAFAPWALMGAVAVALPALAQVPVPSPSLVSPMVDRKIAEARAKGFWVIDEGEHLYRIARHFETGSVALKGLVEELVATNPNAFILGDPGRLVVGARLRLPDRLHSHPAAEGVPAPPDKAAAASIPTVPATEGTTPAEPSVDRAPGRNGTPKTSPTAAPYVDNLIVGITGSPEDDPAGGAPRDSSPGLRTWTVDYRLDQRQVTGLGTSVAQGVALLHRRETRAHGDFTLDLQAGVNRPAPSDPNQERSRERFTLHHDNFALTEGVTSASSLGVIRSALTPWIATSHRIFLPTSTLAGASTQIDAGANQFIASFGSVGQIAGLNVQGFERTSGRLATLGASRELSPTWRAGANAISLAGSNLVRDHTAAVISTEFEPPRIGGSMKVNALADDAGHAGLWADGQFRSGRSSNRLGVYRVDPNTLFGEATLLNDTQGAYWRSEYRMGPDLATFGFDLNQNNLERDPARGGSESAGGYANVSLRLDRNTTWGGGFSLREDRARTGERAASLATAANVFYGRTGVLGQTRVDLSHSDTRPRSGGANETVSQVQLNQNWPRIGNVESSILLTHTDEHLTDRRVRRNVGSLTMRGPLVSNVNWDLSLTAADIDDGEASERNYNASVSIDWAIATRWYLNLRWLRNQIQPTAPIAGAQPFIKENQVQFLVRYEDSYGTPYERIGTAGGRSGTGVLVGAVFFDENGDGVRQATERGAAGVTVVLDNRFTQVTDSDGRYNFNLVPAGRHAVSLVMDRVPLPWSVSDEAAQPVRVEVRGQARRDFPLTRIGP